MVDLEAEPIQYTVPRFVLWTLVGLVGLADLLIHYRVALSKQILFLLCWGAVMIQVFREVFSVTLDIFAYKGKTDEKLSALEFFIFVDSVSRVSKLTLLMLIGAAYRILRNKLTNMEIIYISALSVTEVISMTLVDIYDIEVVVGIFYVVWIIAYFLIWIFIFFKTYTNYADLRRLCQQSRELSDDDRVVALLKKKLFKQFGIVLIIYVCVSILATLIQFIVEESTSDASENYWAYIIPTDVVEFFLLIGLCYIFRARDNNPYVLVDVQEDDIAIGPLGAAPGHSDGHQGDDTSPPQEGDAAKAAAADGHDDEDGEEEEEEGGEGRGDQKERPQEQQP